MFGNWFFMLNWGLNVNTEITVTKINVFYAEITVEVWSLVLKFIGLKIIWNFGIEVLRSVRVLKLTD